MKKRLLIISPGPVMEINKTLYKRLSQNFTGAVLTSSSRNKNIHLKSVYDFDYHCIRYNYKSKFLTNFKFFLFAIYLCFKSRLDNNKFDLVTTYDPLKTGLFGVICMWILGTKFTPEINGVYSSPFAYLDEEKSFKIKIKRYIYIKIEAFVLKRADGIKILCESQLEPFKDIAKGKIVKCFPCFVNADIFFDCHGVNEKKEILFVGFPFKLKGVDILINAFNLISNKYPDWKLKILGYFPEGNELFDYIKGNRIMHHLPVEHSEMPYHMCSCSFFVLPSRTEAMGRVLVEAMAAGKPVIGSNVDGIPNVIKDGVNGFLFENEDVNDLAQKLEKLITNPELRKRMGNEGRKCIKNKFSEDIFFSNTMNFYNEILK